MDLILDPKIVIALCLEPESSYVVVKKAIESCKQNGYAVWLYVGSVQFLEDQLANQIKNLNIHNELDWKKKAKLLLKDFAKDKQWLSALSEEGNVFDSDYSDFERMKIAISRFPENTIKILTLDEEIKRNFSTVTITPNEYLELNSSKKNIDFIDLAFQQTQIRAQLEKRIHKVLHHGQYIMGQEVFELEKKLENYTNSKYCITVSSGTEALLISLMALGIKPGDEVITSPFTFVATAEVIALLGAIPIFVDIDANTANIDISLIESKITSKTKAIIPVSLYGQVADMDEINELATRNGNIPIIEDAAQSFGANYKGRKSCNVSTIGCTSFFPSKPLGCYGDGGAIFTNDETIAKACKEIRVHGQEKRYYHTRIGVGGRMDTIQAAIVLAKLENFDNELKSRIKIGNRYNQLFDDLNIKRIKQKPDRNSVFAQYTIVVENRSSLQEHLKQLRIPTAVHYPIPLNEQPAYSIYSSDMTPISSEMAKKVMSIPMDPYLSEEEQDYIVNSISRHKV